MIYLLITFLLTILISAFCSTLEAMVLSTTTLDIENLKKRSKKRGELLEKFNSQIDKTTSAILTLNTIANTFGATLCGVLFSALYGSTFVTKYIFPAVITISILVFAEVLPKNFGVLYRPFLQYHLIYPLHWVRFIMSPISAFFSGLVGMLMNRHSAHNQSEDEIILLAQKGAKDGLLTQEEKSLILNTLALDDVLISEIMTPRTVILAFDEDMSIDEVLAKYKVISFARVPIFKDNIDNITGIVRRKELLLAKANNQGEILLKNLAHHAIFVPENGSALSILKHLVKSHQHMGIVVDEFASLTGVVTLEDIFENLLGSEIFEKDDIAVDMREFARHKKFEDTKNFIESKKNQKNGN